MRRYIASAIMMAIAVSTNACAPSRIEQLELDVAALEDRLDNARDAMSELNLALLELEVAIESAQSGVQDFSQEDWRVNVPEVSTAVDEIEYLMIDVLARSNNLEAGLLY